MATGASKAMFSSMLTYYIENVNMYLQDDEIKLLLYIAKRCFNDPVADDGGGYRARIHYADMAKATGLDMAVVYFAMEQLTMYDIVIVLDQPTEDGSLYGIGASPNIEDLRRRLGAS